MERTRISSKRGQGGKDVKRCPRACWYLVPRREAQREHPAQGVEASRCRHRSAFTRSTRASWIISSSTSKRKPSRFMTRLAGRLWRPGSIGHRTSSFGSGPTRTPPTWRRRRRPSGRRLRLRGSRSAAALRRWKSAKSRWPRGGVARLLYTLALWSQVRPAGPLYAAVSPPPRGSFQDDDYGGNLPVVLAILLTTARGDVFCWNDAYPSHSRGGVAAGSGGVGVSVTSHGSGP